MATSKCSHCNMFRDLDQFKDKFERTLRTCLNCRTRGRKNDSRPERKNRYPCEKCSKHPYFNIPGQNKGRFCGEHKEEGMVNVLSIKCEHENCTSQPCFNFEGKLGRFCAKHRLEGMVNVRERRCEHENCFRKPVYNFPSETRGKFCREHKEDEMFDVLSIRCEHENCFKRGNFNFPGKPPRFCGEHRETGMVDVKTRKCDHDGCTTVPVYNFTGQKRGILCLTHKKEGMVDVKNPRCKTPMCDIILPGSNTGYCARCSAYMFPDKPTRFKTRELKLKEHLVIKYSDKTITHDKRVECHLYRPDFVFDMGSHTIVIELDENQHKAYDTSCDNKRLMSIFQGLGSRPMIMLRFNPDKYTGAPGCFKNDGQLSGNGREWTRRVKYLDERLEHWFGTQPDREIILEHLFFDTK